MSDLISACLDTLDVIQTPNTHFSNKYENTREHIFEWQEKVTANPLFYVGHLSYQRPINWYCCNVIWHQYSSLTSCSGVSFPYKENLFLPQIDSSTVTTLHSLISLQFPFWRDDFFELCTVLCFREGLDLMHVLDVFLHERAFLAYTARVTDWGLCRHIKPCCQEHIYFSHEGRLHTTAVLFAIQLVIMLKW